MNSRHKAGRISAIWLAAALVLAGPASGLEAAKDVGPFRLAPGDRVTIAVFGEADLSGDFIVDSAGNVQLPVVGDIPVQDLTLKEVEAAIVKRLDGYLNRPSVSARITQFRPIYVVGDVKTPGSFAFEYGDTVLSAIAKAGGFGLKAEVPMALRTEFLAADERLRVLETTQRALIIRRDRLEAQRDGSDDFQAPTFEDRKTGEALAHTVASEREALVTQSEAHRKQISLLNEQIPLLEGEIESIQEQVGFEEHQLELIQAHLKDYQKLLSSGLARQYTGIELQREEARNKTNIAGYRAAISRLHLNIGEIKIKIHELEEAYKQRVITELRETQTRLDEVETTIPFAREVREVRLQQGGMVSGLDQNNRRITIIRKVNGEHKMFTADRGTPLAPGDVIEVSGTTSGTDTSSVASVIFPPLNDEPKVESGSQ